MTDINLIHAPRGSGRSAEPLAHVEVPDAWHLATAMPKLAKINAAMALTGSHLPEDIEVADDYRDECDSIREASELATTISIDGEKAEALILRLWHLSHDLLRHARAVAEAAEQVILVCDLTDGETASKEPGRAIQGLKDALSGKAVGRE